MKHKQPDIADPSPMPVGRRESCRRCLAPRCRATAWWVLWIAGAAVHLCDACHRRLKGDA